MQRERQSMGFGAVILAKLACMSAEHAHLEVEVDSRGDEVRIMGSAWTEPFQFAYAGADTIRLWPKWLADESRPDPVLLDVREPWELELCQLAGSQHIPMHLVPMRCADELDADRDIVVICHHGMRSRQVASFLIGRGYREIFNLAGGIDAWSHEVDPSVPVY